MSGIFANNFWTVGRDFFPKLLFEVLVRMPTSWEGATCQQLVPENRFYNTTVSIMMPSQSCGVVAVGPIFQETSKITAEKGSVGNSCKILVADDDCPAVAWPRGQTCENAWILTIFPWHNLIVIFNSEPGAISNQYLSVYICFYCQG